MHTFNKETCSHVNKPACLPNYKRTCTVQIMEKPTPLGARLSRARDAQGLNQKQLAAKIKERYPDADVSQQSISQLESGQSSTTTCLVEIAITLGLNPVWLATGEGPERAVDYARLDPKTEHVAAVMQQQPDYVKDQIVKIVDTVAQPKPDASGSPTDNPGRRKSR